MGPKHKRWETAALALNHKIIILIKLQKVVLNLIALAVQLYQVRDVRVVTNFDSPIIKIPMIAAGHLRNFAFEQCQNAISLMIDIVQSDIGLVSNFYIFRDLFLVQKYFICKVGSYGLCVVLYGSFGEIFLGFWGDTLRFCHPSLAYFP